MLQLASRGIFNMLWKLQSIRRDAAEIRAEQGGLFYMVGSSYSTPFLPE